MYRKVLIATFSLWEESRTPINGMIEPLLSFFLPKAEEVDLIEGLHPGSSKVITRIESYQKGRLVGVKTAFVSLLLSPLLYWQNKNATQIIFKIRDFFAVFEGVLRLRKKYDLFIGLESIYTLTGILLKKIGLVKKVIYYVSDYSPTRYKNKLLNKIYLFLDRFCCYHADVVWDVSPAMKKVRIKTGLNLKKSAPILLVSNALFSQQISYLPLNKIKPYTLVYAGTLGQENGPDIIIKAMPKITEKFPKTTLHIIGGNGEFERKLKQLTKKLKLEKNVIFHGFIKDLKILTNTIKEFMIGIAPYREIPDSPRWYADATKLRLYLGAGLPIVTTYVPPLGREIQRKGAGILVKDNQKQLANAIIKIFSNKDLYKKMRRKAISFAKNNTWENSYKNALKKMENKLIQTSTLTKVFEATSF